MKTQIVALKDFETHKAGDIVSEYDGEPRQAEYGGPWGSPNLFAHVEVDAKANRRTLKAEIKGKKWIKKGEKPVFEDPQDDSWELVEGKHVKLVKDETKTREEKLNLLRMMRKPKLEYASIEIEKHYDADDKKIGFEGDWQRYRIALRDVTDPFKDHASNPDHAAAIDFFKDDWSDFIWPEIPTEE